MDQKTRLVINTASNLSTLLFTGVLSFLLAPFILDQLGRDAYGVWALIGSVFAYSRLLSLGLNSAVNRWIPMYIVQEDYEGINRVVNTSLFAYLVVGAILMLAVLGLSTQFPVLFDLPEDLRETSKIALIIVGVGFTIITVTNVFSAILSGLQRYELMLVSDTATDLLRAALLVVLLTNGHGLIAVAVIAAGAAALRGLFKAYFAFRELKPLRLNLSRARMSTFREMLGYSINTFLYSCGAVIQAQSALICVGIVFSASVVPEYSMPLILTNLMGSIVMASSAAMKPATTHLEASGQVAQVRKLYLLGTKSTLLMLFPVASFLIVFGGDLLRIWLGENFMEAHPQILAILAVGAAFRLWHIPAFFVVVGLGKHRVFGILTLATGLSSIVLASLFVFAWDAGILGIALGFSLSEVMLALFFVTPHCCGAAGIGIREELKESLVPAVIASVPYWIALAAAKSWLGAPSGYIELGALVLGLGVVVLIGWWLWGLTSLEKHRFAQILQLRSEALQINREGT